MPPIPLEAWAFGACFRNRSVFILDLHLDIFILLHCKLLARENIINKAYLLTRGGITDSGGKWRARISRTWQKNNHSSATSNIIIALGQETTADLIYI